MKIFIARHGKTTENKQKRISGNSNNAKLIKEGFEHAQNLVNVLKEYDIEAIFSSPLNRAINTSKPFSEKRNLDINIIDNLREFDFGILDSLKESQKEVSKALEMRRQDLNFKFPQGESYNDVLKRTNQFLEKLLKKNYKNVLLVAHAGVNRALIYLLNKDKTITLDKINTPNNIIYIFDKDKKQFSWINTLTNEKGKGLLFRETF